MKRGKKSTWTEEDEWGNWDPDLAYAVERILQKQGQWVTSKEDEARLKRWLSRARRVGPTDMSRRWRQLSEARRLYVRLLGIAGRLAELFAEPDKRKKLNDWYEAARWPGILAQLTLWRARHEAILEAVMFERWHFVPDSCDYKKHWYLRHTVGRHPEGCPLHARAGRQYRYRKAKSAYRGTR